MPLQDGRTSRAGHEDRHSNANKKQKRRPQLLRTTRPSGVQLTFTEALERRVLLSGSASFAAGQSFATGSDPMAAAVGDFNGDGKLDVAVTNFQDGTVSVFLGNGDGTFQPQATYLAESNSPGPLAGAISVADVNGDGFPDLVVTTGDNMLNVLLGNGNGTFQAPTTTASATGTANADFLALADLNGDGILDAVMTDSGDSAIVILPGNGDGTFGTPRDISVGGAPTSVAIADVNGDGKPDLIVADNAGINTPGQAQVLINQGNFGFSAPTPFATGSVPQSIAVADINGDGIPDIVTGNVGDNDISVLLGVGDGIFQAQQTYATGTDPDPIKIADVNGDGFPDLLATNQANNSLSVLLGNGDGTFQPQQLTSTGGSAASIVVGDFNADGKPDIISVNPNGNSINVLNNTSSEAPVTALVNIDFTAAGPVQSGAAEIGAAGDQWNNIINPDFVPNSPISKSGLTLTTVTGSASPITLSFSTQLANHNPSPTTFEGTPYANLMSDYLIADPTEQALNEPGPPGTVTLSGLTPGGGYSLYLYSAGKATGNTTLFAINGVAHAVTFDPTVNYLEPGVNLTRFTNIPANGSGQITLTFDSHSGQEADLNGLQLFSNAVASTTTVTSSANPLTVGGSVTFTATITPASPAPTGTVTFYNGTTEIGAAVSVVNGTALTTTTLLTAGVDAITANYSGNVAYNPSVSTPLNEFVGTTPGSITTLTSSPNPAGVGALVTFTATVAPSVAGSPTPTGGVTFYDGATPLGEPVGLSNGIAIFYSQTLSLGVHNISSVYSPATFYAGSTSPTVSQSITLATTTTTLTSSSNPGPLGASIALTATVSSGSAGLIPTGAVAFFDGGTQIGSATLTADGSATLFISSLASGMHAIMASYAGDANDLASSSITLSQSIQAADLSPTLKGPASTSVITGTPLKLHEKLTLTASNGAVNGAATAIILLSPSENASDSVMTLATVSSAFKLKAGKARTFNLRVPKSIPTTIAAGVDHVLIALTDAAGNKFTLDSGQTITVIAPVVDLAGSFVKFPASAKAGKRFATTINITNAASANIAASGALPIAIETSPDGQLSDATPLQTLRKHINLKPGKSMKITLTATLGSTTYLVVNLDPGKVLLPDDSDLANNLFVQQIVAG